ncbi:hypothetical protein LTR51_008606 [Lithohypha guttulata]|nr:hypothetical protein LTR51_008606 [Lithohypha guttulata]
MANGMHQHYHAASPSDHSAAEPHVGSSGSFAPHRRDHPVLFLPARPGTIEHVCGGTVRGKTVLGVVGASAPTCQAYPDPAGARAELDLAARQSVAPASARGLAADAARTSSARATADHSSQTPVVAVHRGSPSSRASSWPLVDLSLLTSLEQLHVQGDVWSRVQDTFTGVSHTVKLCLLRGSMVLGRRSDEFFGRIATGLQYLFCHGTHVIGELSTEFPQLTFLALHQTVHGPGVFLCPSAAVHAVSIEADDSYGRGRVEDLNTLLQLVLDHTQPTLRLLALRTGLSCALAADTVQRFPLMQQLTTVVLDGAVVEESPLLTTYVGSAASQRTFIRLASWLQSRVSQRHVGKHSIC